MCACVISGAVQWPGNLRSLVRRRAPARNSRNEEGPDRLRGEYLPGANSVADGEDSLPDIGLFLRPVARSEGQVSQIHFSWKNSVIFLIFFFFPIALCSKASTNNDDQLYPFLIIRDFVTNVL